jgi:hypothetical protein
VLKEATELDKTGVGPRRREQATKWRQMGITCFNVSASLKFTRGIAYRHRFYTKQGLVAMTQPKMKRSDRSADLDPQLCKLKTPLCPDQDSFDTRRRRRVIESQSTASKAGPPSFIQDIALASGACEMVGLAKLVLL